MISLPLSPPVTRRSGVPCFFAKSTTSSSFLNRGSMAVPFTNTIHFPARDKDSHRLAGSPFEKFIYVERYPSDNGLLPDIHSDFSSFTFPTAMTSEPTRKILGSRRLSLRPGEWCVKDLRKENCAEEGYCLHTSELSYEPPLQYKMVPAESQPPPSTMVRARAMRELCQREIRTEGYYSRSANNDRKERTAGNVVGSSELMIGEDRCL